VPKAEGGPSMLHYIERRVQHYRDIFKGAVKQTTGIRDVRGNVVPVYTFTPSPDVKYKAAYQSAVYLEDELCYIRVLMIASSSEDHERVRPSFERLVAGFRKK